MAQLEGYVSGETTPRTIEMAAGADGRGILIADVDAMPANTTATGNIIAADVTAAPHTVPTTGSYVAIVPPAGAGTVLLHITGVFIGQVEFEGSGDLVNYPAVQASNGSATVSAVAGLGPAALNAIFILPGGGYRTIRVRASAWTSGTAVITLVASVGTSASIPTGAIPAGANAIGSVAQGTAGASAWPVTLQPATSGGCTPYSNLDLDETGVLVTTAAAHKLYGYYFFNTTTAILYVKIYDHADAPTAAETPVLRLPLPPAAGANLSSPNGIAFALGIGLRATTGVADADVGAPAANAVIANVWYK